jgi:hypothetical protein
MPKFRRRFVVERRRWNYRRKISTSVAQTAAAQDVPDAKEISADLKSRFSRVKRKNEE